ncbi:MAG TPA: holo-ACP synthase [bacterium]|nr:holo-ACP synthase [bacterium]
MIIGIGCDFADDTRLAEIMARREDSFLQRVFTPAEQAYCSARAVNAPHYAARFAAKEALFKALGTGWAQGVSWLDAEVSNLPSGEPQLTLRGAAAEILARKLAPGTKAKIHLSLSHAGDMSMAMVVLEQCASC